MRVCLSINTINIKYSLFQIFISRIADYYLNVLSAVFHNIVLVLLIILSKFLLLFGIQNQVHANIGGGRDNIIENNVMYNATLYSIQVDGRGVGHRNDKDLYNHLKVFDLFNPCPAE